MKSEPVHEPVLLQEVLQILDPQPGDFIIDGTFGSGGHSSAILKKISPKGRLLGIDWDEENIKHSKIASEKNVTLRHGSYANLPEILKKEKLPLADGLLLDVGFSSVQLVTGRGFSFSDEAANEPLLMTYDDTSEPVWKILREIKEEDLANIIFELGGERMSRRIAKAIKERGRRKPIMTAGDLAETVRGILPKGYERGRIDPATRTFQALRIYANKELENLQNVLKKIPEIVRSGGRVAVITFHSLEDRIVKQSFQNFARQKQAELLTKKPIAATHEEILKNPRSRSAKIRGIKFL
jgi:16S rRNA (cytosine1402-N4)-methyltransferase